MNDSVIDAAVFEEMRDLMDDALPEFISTYLENSPRLLDALAIAMKSGDMDGVFHHAHQLKGGSGSIGAMRVYQLAIDIENCIREASEMDELERLHSELEAAYNQAAAELKTHL